MYMYVRFLYVQHSHQLLRSRDLVVWLKLGGCLPISVLYEAKTEIRYYCSWEQLAPSSILLYIHLIEWTAKFTLVSNPAMSHDTCWSEKQTALCPNTLFTRQLLIFKWDYSDIMPWNLQLILLICSSHSVKEHQPLQQPWRRVSAPIQTSILNVF